MQNPAGNRGVDKRRSENVAHGTVLAGSRVFASPYQRYLNSNSVCDTTLKVLHDGKGVVIVV